MRVLGPLELESLKAVSLHVGTGEFNPGPLGEPTLLIPETDIIFPAPPPHTHTLFQAGYLYVALVGLNSFFPKLFWVNVSAAAEAS